MRNFMILLEVRGMNTTPQKVNYYGKARKLNRETVEEMVKDYIRGCGNPQMCRAWITVLNIVELDKDDTTEQESQRAHMF